MGGNTCTVFLFLEQEDVLVVRSCVFLISVPMLAPVTLYMHTHCRYVWQSGGSVHCFVPGTAQPHLVETDVGVLPLARRH